MRLAAWTLRARAPTLTVRVAPSWLVVLFVVVEFWTVFPWAAWRSALAASVGVRAVVVGLAGLAAGLVAGPLDVDAPFRRLLPRWRVGVTLLPTALYAAVPLLALDRMLPGGPWPRLLGQLAALLWVGRGRWLLPTLVLAVGETLGPARLVVDAALLLGLGAVPAPVARPTWTFRPRGPFLALLGRDLLCLWRTERPRAWTAVALAPWPAVLVWGLRRNGGLDGTQRGVAIGVLLCALSPGAAAALAAVRARLGDRFMPRAWPVPAALRLAAAVVFVYLWLLPAHVAMAATGGLVPALVPMPLVVMLGAGAAWLSTFTALNLGGFLAWAVVAVGLALAERSAWGWMFAVPPLWHAWRRWR